MKKVGKILIISGIVAVLFGGFFVFGGVEVVDAAACNGTNANKPCLPNPISSDGGALSGPEELYGRIIRAFLAIIGVASLVVFVFAGLTFVLSGGSPERVKKARDTMVFAVIGVAVSLGSYVILSFVINALRGTLAT